MGIVYQTFQVAFEMPHIDGIESDQSSKQAPVRLGQPGPAEVSLSCEPFLQCV